MIKNRWQIRPWKETFTEYFEGTRRELGIFLFTTASRTALRPNHPPIQWVPGAHSLGVKRPGREDHSPPSSAGGQRMSGAIPPLPKYAFMAWCSIKAQGHLYFYCPIIHMDRLKETIQSLRYDLECYRYSNLSGVPHIPYDCCHLYTLTNIKGDNI
jgi:hypothetical protein